MDFELQVVRGRSAAQTLKLADGVNTVGRLDECTVRIKSSQVSRRHCELFEKKGLLLVKDLGSANGTFVNGKKVNGQQVLEPGDEISIGGVHLRVAKIGQAPPVKTPPATVGGKAPVDTAVVEAIVESPGADDEFEIDFDDPVSVAEGPAAPAAAVDEDDILGAIAFDDAPPPPKAKAAPANGPKEKPPAPKTEPAPAPVAVPEPAPASAAPAKPDDADQAIADFLLDIKLDDE